MVIYCFILILLVAAASARGIYYETNGIVIRNVESDLVFDATQDTVQLQPFSGSESQLWTIESTNEDTFFIINKGNGKALDIEGGGTSNANIITYDKHGHKNQQWYIKDDDTIHSAVADLVLDIPKSNYRPGITIQAYPHHGGKNQQFSTELVISELA